MSLINRCLYRPLAGVALTPALPAWAEPIQSGTLAWNGPVLWLSAFCVVGAMAMGATLVLVQRQRRWLKKRRIELEHEKRERSRLAALLNAIPDGVYFKDASGAFEALSLIHI